MNSDETDIGIDRFVR